MLQKREGIDNYVAYVGTGSPRFYLPLDQQLPQANFSQFVLRAKDTEAREDLRELADQRRRPAVPRTAAARDAPGERPAGRLSGAVPRVRRTHRPRARAGQAGRGEGAREPATSANVNLDWDEPNKVVRLVIDQERARALGVSSAQLASSSPARCPARMSAPTAKATSW